jgi:Xaa-Pro aminopeptidase
VALITNDPLRIERTTGFDAWYYCLPAHLSLDGWRSELPIGLLGNGEPLIFVKEIDRSNIEPLTGIKARFVFHTPYFTFDRYLEPPDARESLASALREMTASGDRLDDTLPAHLHESLDRKLGLEPAADLEVVRPGYHYEIPLGHVADAFRPGPLSIRGAASERMSALGVEGPLATYVDRDDDGFDLLFRMMADEGIDVLLLSSPLNVQEVTGFPMTSVEEGVWAILEKNGRSVHVLAKREVPWLAPGRTRAQEDVASGLLRGGRVGYEDQDLTEGARRAFDLDLEKAVPSTRMLRRWRELLSWRDLGFYVVAVEVTLAGIESALHLVEARLSAGDVVTEVDAYERYRETVAGEIRRKDLPIRVKTYFTHTHAGNRSLLPAKATDHGLSPLTSLKIDAGLLVFDERGLYRAVSDITRSVVGSSRAKEFYGLLDDALVAGVISACRPGVSGQEVFTKGMTFLEPHRDQIVDWGFAPDTGMPLTDSFARDVGHLLGKEEPATVSLRLGNEERLISGVVGAAEFQWPYRDHCIGVEDMFVVTDQGPVNLTRRKES